MARKKRWSYDTIKHGHTLANHERHLVDERTGIYPTTQEVGPWQAGSKGSAHYIVNVETGETKKMGPVRMRGINYFDKARAEAARRNEALGLGRTGQSGMAHYDVPSGMLGHVYPSRGRGGKKRHGAPKPKFKLGQRVSYAGHRGKVTNWPGGIQHDPEGGFYRYKLEMEPGSAWTRVWANEDSLTKLAKEVKAALKK